MVDEADKDGTGLLTEKEFMQSSATEVSIVIVSKMSLGIKFSIIAWKYLFKNKTLFYF